MHDLGEGDPMNVVLPGNNYASTWASYHRHAHFGRKAEA